MKKTTYIRHADVPGPNEGIIFIHSPDVFKANCKHTGTDSVDVTGVCHMGKIVALPKGPFIFSCSRPYRLSITISLTVRSGRTQSKFFMW